MEMLQGYFKSLFLTKGTQALRMGQEQGGTERNLEPDKEIEGESSEIFESLRSSRVPQNQ